MDLVICPTLNEVENIDALVSGVLAEEGFHLLIVDDDSTDGTWQKVEKISATNESVQLLHRKENPGFRNSYLDGFEWAKQRSDVRYVFTMDADLSHKPEYLPIMRDALNDVDLVVGSRYVAGGGVRNWSLWRRVLSRNANRFASLTTGLPVDDCTAGFNGFSLDFFRKLNTSSLLCNSYGFLIELKHLFWRAGATFREVPIIFQDREHGQTKFNSGMIKEAMGTCLRLRKNK